MKLVLLILLYMFTVTGFVHVKPAPFFKKPITILDAVDPVSFSILPIIHKTLFEIGENSIPSPVLVRKFSVEKDQLKYKFVLGKYQFHNGLELNAEDVKYTIERFVQKKGVNWERLLIINGSLEFSEGKSHEIKGLKLDKNNKNSFTIELVKPDPLFLYKLCDFRLSVLKKGGNFKNGLGLYKYTPSNKRSELRFIKVDKKTNGPSLVIYKLLNKKDALSQFKEGLVHDLVLYHLNKNELSSVKSSSNLTQFHFSRTYGLFVNSKILGKSEREQLLALVDKKKILKKCYSNEKLAHYLIPPGFIGYSASITGNLKPAKAVCPVMKMTIVVPEGLKNENCLLKEVKEKLRTCKNITISKVKFSKVISGWKENQIAGYFGYVEAESSADLFSHFVPNSTFELGVKKDKTIIKLLDSYLKELDLEKKFNIALLINNHIDSLDTLFPLFYENLILVTSKKYKELQVGVRSGVSIKMNNFVLREK